MDELPQRAKAVLSLARDVHDPPDAAARERVRTKLAAALLVSPASGAAAAHAAKVAQAATTKATYAGLFGSAKLWISGAVLVAAAGGAGLVAVSSSKQVNQPAHVSPAAAAAKVAPAEPTSRAPRVEAVEASPERAPETPAPEVVEASRNVRKATPRRVASAGSAHPSLAEERALLARAAEQLAAHDPDAALGLLSEHRKRFRQSQLSEEREGLRVLAHCLQHPAGTRAEARAFITRSPASVLVARIERACDL